jgi:hypothetical protein
VSFFQESNEQYRKVNKSIDALKNNNRFQGVKVSLIHFGVRITIKKVSLY